MADYISREAAICIADYAADEHPYSKERDKPETYSDYNQGWNDACDYILDKLEEAPAADVEPVVRCRECRYYTSHVCCHPRGMKFTSDSNYCSYGQRRDQSADVRKKEGTPDAAKEAT